MLTAVLVLILLIVLNAFFAASEIALISLNDNKVDAMAEAGNKKAKLLQSLLGEPSRFLATIQIGITLAGFLASAFAADSFAGALADAAIAVGVPIPRELLQTISVIIITLILSYFTLVFGELVPKRIAMVKAEAIANFVASPLNMLAKVTSPFVRLLTSSTNVIVRLFGVDPHAEDEQVTEEEIRMMIQVGEEKGTIQEIEKILINNIFELDNKVVSEIMTHRRNIIGLPVDMTIKEAVKKVKNEPYTRFPVYRDNVDNIVGILHVKDFFQLVEIEEAEASKTLESIIRATYFVPESKKTDELLKELQASKTHMAIVIDEYGGTAGLVTIEDLLEEIVGNIYDEYDLTEEKEFERLEDESYLVSGQVSIRSLNELLELEITSDEYDTLSGFLIGELGRIPKPHEHPAIEISGYSLIVEEVDDLRISKVKIKQIQ